MNNPSDAAPRRQSGRLLLLLGLAVPVLGVAAYVAQVWAQRLLAPWYVPAAATLGVVLVVASLWWKRTVWRILALVLVVLVAAGEWAMLVEMRLPAYAGPVAEGKQFPSFTTTRADGAAFTQADLSGGPNSVLVFFRGRW